MRHRERSSRAIGLGLAALIAAAPGCSAKGGNGSASSTVPVTTTISTIPTTTAGDATASSPADGTSSSTAAVGFDFGDLGRDRYCEVTKQIVDATSALVPSATPQVVKDGLATMQVSLGTLASGGAAGQRPQYAAAVAVLDRAAATIEANGFDVAKTQSQLSVLDPEGALVGAITVVLTQRQIACA